ncbi:MAG TPA: lasso peptide biosynthesis B2 protein [Actinomycetota bacterium]|nr:lasso peptide biosynthesis B2 protein [Actinomycetota bacterium]
MSITGFMALERLERSLSLKAFALLPLIELSLRVAGLPKTARYCGASLERGDAPISIREANAKQSIVMRASARATRRWVAADTCLRRALLTAALLREASPMIRIGVRSDSTGMEAHAWVEVDGSSLDAGSQSYTPLIAAWTKDRA